jgi:hypothetical protein
VALLYFDLVFDLRLRPRVRLRFGTLRNHGMVMDLRADPRRGRADDAALRGETAKDVELLARQWVALARRGDTAFAVEDNGFTGSQPEVLTAARSSRPRS